MLDIFQIFEDIWDFGDFLGFLGFLQIFRVFLFFRILGDFSDLLDFFRIVLKMFNEFFFFGEQLPFRDALDATASSWTGSSSKFWNVRGTRNV